MSMLAGAAVMPQEAWAQPSPSKAALYASVGPQLTQYDIDVRGAALTRRGYDRAKLDTGSLLGAVGNLGTLNRLSDGGETGRF